MFLGSSISDRTSRFVRATLEQTEEPVEKHISSKLLRIELDPSVAATLSGQLILFTLLNLLLRLDTFCPQLEVRLPPLFRHPLLRLLEPQPLAKALGTFFAPFPAMKRLTINGHHIHSEAVDLRLVISPRPEPGAISLWADGWVVYMNAAAPRDQVRDNSVGANVAAALGAAEVFKRLIVDLPLKAGIVVVPTKQLVFSTYDYRLSADSNPPLPPAITLDGSVIVGLGGIGSAFVSAMTSLSAIRGRLSLVDGDILDETNLNRFLIAVPGDTGSKVDLCRRVLAFHSQVDTYPMWFDQYIELLGVQHEYMVVGVDSDLVRRAIQATRPRLILNAGTSDVASCQVTRHDYTHGACLSCIARDDILDHPAEREIARQLGLDLSIILKFQSTGLPLPADLLQRSSTLDRDGVLKLQDLSLGEIQQRLCGQIQLISSQEEAAVSISFLSALPGFLLLGELIKEQNYPEAIRPPLNQAVNHALISLLGRVHPALLHGWREKHADCDCTRPAYQRAYARKWA